MAAHRGLDQRRPRQGAPQAPSSSLDANAAALGFEVYEQSVPTIQKVAVVTGGSSGIGRAVASLFAARGLRVYAASRNPERESSNHALLQSLALDITQESSVTSALDAVLEHAGRIDVLVNAAGYALLGAIEDVSIEEARAQFETNFFGALRVIRAVLPTMRAQGHGRIVNISSVLGLVPAPYMGIYAASKHALEGYTETLDHEVRGFGVRAVLVEPHFTKTALAHHGTLVSSSLEAYRAQGIETTAAIRRDIERGEEPHRVAEVVWRAVNDKRPALRYAVGRAALLSRLRRFVPPRLFDRSLRRQFELHD